MVNFDPTQVQTNIQKYVDTLLVYDKKKITELENRQSALQQKSSAVSQVISLLSSFSSSLNVNFDSLAVRSTNDSVAQATASGKINGSVSINVDRLASYQVLDWTKLSGSDSSSAFHFDSSSQVSANSFWSSLVGSKFNITFELGDGSSESVEVDLTRFSQDSVLSQVLDDFAFQVNAHSSKVRLYKQKLNDGTFILQSSALGSGKNNAIKSVAFGSMIFSNEEDLSALDASFTVNGYSYTRSSNTFSDIITNLTVTLKGIGSTMVTVSSDTSTILQGMSNFVQSFKAFSDKLRGLINVDPSNQGALASDASTLRQVLDGIRTRLMSARAVNVDGVEYGFNPSLIGISFDEYGTISLDTSKLNNYLSSNVKGQDILRNWWADVSSDIRKYIDKALGSNGTIGRLQSNYNSSIKGISDQIKQLNAQMEEKRATLVSQMGVIFNSLYQYQSMFAQMNSYFSVS